MTTAILKSSLNDELSAEEIDQLLAQATTRLEAKAATTRKDASSKFNIPRLDAGKDNEVSRISREGAIVKVKGGPQRKEHSAIRKVEDPIAIKAMAQEVSCLYNCLSLRMKISQIFFLSRARVPFWLPFCKLRAFFS